MFTLQFLFTIMVLIPLWSGFPRVIWLSLASERQSVAGGVSSVSRKRVIIDFAGQSSRGCHSGLLLSDQAAASGSVVDVAIYRSLEAK